MRTLTQGDPRGRAGRKRVNPRAMTAPGDIHYARTTDGIDIAYTVLDEGPGLQQQIFSVRGIR
jgi:hypothetical protein